MAEYIEREKALKILRDSGDAYGDFSTERSVYLSAREKVSRIPAADVAPVVRCKDCKHLMFSDFYGECSNGHMGIVRPDDFCSYGERMDEGEPE